MDYKQKYYRYINKFLLHNKLIGGNHESDLTNVLTAFSSKPAIVYEGDYYYNIVEFVCAFVMNKEYETLYQSIQTNEAICSTFGKKISKTLIRDVIEHIFNVKEQFIVELIVNGFDSQRAPDSKPVGKFGVGFFSSLVPIINSNIKMKIITRFIEDGNLLKYKLSFFYNDDNFFINVKNITAEEDDIVTTGTTIIYESPTEFDPTFVDNLKSEIQKLLLFNSGKLYVNDTLINIYSDPSDKTVHIKLSPNLLSITDKGTGIPINILFTKLLVPSTSTKGLDFNVAAKVYNDENKTNIIDKLVKNNFSDFIITVNTVVIFKASLPSTLNKIYHLDLPSDFDVPIARNDILIDSETNFNIYIQHLKKLFNNTIISIKNVTELLSLLNIYFKYTSQIFAKNKTIGVISSYLDSHSYIAIPHNKILLKDILAIENYFLVPDLYFTKLKNILAAKPKLDKKIFMNMEIINVQNPNPIYNLVTFDQYVFTNLSDINKLIKLANTYTEVELIANIDIDDITKIPDELTIINEHYIKSDINKKVSEILSSCKEHIKLKYKLNDNSFLKLNLCDTIIIDILKHFYFIYQYNISTYFADLLKFIYNLYEIGLFNINNLKELYQDLKLKFSIQNLNSVKSKYSTYGSNPSITIKFYDRLTTLTGKLYSTGIYNINYKFPRLKLLFSLLHPDFNNLIQNSIDDFFNYDNLFERKSLKSTNILHNDLFFSLHYDASEPFFDQTILDSLIETNKHHGAELKKFFPFLSKINKDLYGFDFDILYGGIDSIVNVENYLHFYKINFNNFIKTIYKFVLQTLDIIFDTIDKLFKLVPMRIFTKNNDYKKFFNSIIKNIYYIIDKFKKFFILHNFPNLLDTKMSQLWSLLIELDNPSNIKHESQFNTILIFLSYINKLFYNLNETFNTIEKLKIPLKKDVPSIVNEQYLNDMIKSFINYQRIYHLRIFNPIEEKITAFDYVDKKSQLIYNLSQFKTDPFVFLATKNYIRIFQIYNYLTDLHEIFKLVNQKTKINILDPKYKNIKKIIDLQYLSNDKINVKQLQEKYSELSTDFFNNIKPIYIESYDEHQYAYESNLYNEGAAEIDKSIFKYLNIYSEAGYSLLFLLSYSFNNIANYITNKSIGEYIKKLIIKFKQRSFYKFELYILIFLHTILYSFKNPKFLPEIDQSSLLESELIDELFKDENIDKIINFLVLINIIDIDNYIEKLSYDFIDTHQLDFNNISSLQLYKNINTFIKLILNKSINIKILDISSLLNPNIANYQKNIKLSNFIKLLYTNDITNFNDIIRLDDSVVADNNFNLQLIALAINSGSPNQVEQSVCIELLQNSIDVSDSVYRFRNWTNLLTNFNIVNIIEYMPEHPNCSIDINIGYQKSGNKFNIIYINRDYVGFNSLDNLVSLFVPYFSEKTQGTGKMGNGFFNSYRNSQNVKIRSVSNTVNFLIDDTPIDKEGNNVKLIEDINKQITLYDLIEPEKPYTDIIITYKQYDIHDFNNRLNLLINECTDILSSIPLFNIKLNEIKVNNNSKLIWSSPNIKVYLKSNINTLSYILTDNVPYQSFELFCIKQNIFFKNIESLKTGIIIDINANKFKPVQSRIDAIIDPEVIAEIKAIIYEVNYYNLLHKLIIKNDYDSLYELSNDTLFSISQILPNNNPIDYTINYTTDMIILRHKIGVELKSISDLILEILFTRYGNNFCTIVNDLSSIISKYSFEIYSKKELFDQFTHYKFEVDVVNNFMVWIRTFNDSYGTVSANKYNSFAHLCDYIAHLWIYNKINDFDKKINKKLSNYYFDIDLDINIDFNLEPHEDAIEPSKIIPKLAAKPEKPIKKLQHIFVEKFIETYIETSYKKYDPTFSVPVPRIEFHTKQSMFSVLGYYIKSDNLMVLSSEYENDIKKLIEYFKKYKEKSILNLRNTNEYKKLFSGFHYTTLLHELEHYRRQMGHIGTTCGITGSHDSIKITYEEKEEEYTFDQTILFFYIIARKNNFIEIFYNKFTTTPEYLRPEILDSDPESKDDDES